MNSVLFGIASAASLGVADFMARFSSRALGATLTYAVVLLIGVITSSVWIAVSGERLIWTPVGCALAIVHGLSVAAMCMLLYAGLARGPVAIVAPIVAAHPAFVLVVNVAMGLRPTFYQWAAMVVIILGGILIARSAEGHPQFAASDRKELRKTIIIALGACLAYVVLVTTGQASAQRIGELQTLWLGRLSGFLLVGVMLAVQRRSIAIPRAWIPFVGAQGLLDTLGYIAFLAGSTTSNPHITMVVASTFSVVTVVLAKFVLKELVSRQQWLAVAMIAAGTAVLSGSA
ncbi:DMT family transporter [Hyphomicrobium sp.]|uniref:DMT family transporter n=1 Tax=Hyphomicrobium sp. TaxID=82 RepID=UPI001DBC5328|nr:DMT family transporter [Hyphomicrobium sp.]MBY0562327.1 DMT family transporter [Hyphomicrobium sp.]